jgi:type IV pilus assembly protein PilX
MTLYVSAVTNQRQQGAALVVSLILLLIMTLVGVAAMSSARLEVSMAGVMQDEEDALRRSERALQFAENNVLTLANAAGPFNFATGSDAYYLPADNINAAATDWTSLVSGNLTGMATNDAFVVEYLGQYKIKGNALNDDGSYEVTAGSDAYATRITVRSTTGGKGVRIVESIYTTRQVP